MPDSENKIKWTMQGQAVGPNDVRSLTADEITVVFQPIVSVSTGRTFAHEVLVRCTRAELSSPPVLFERAVKESACGRLGRLIRDRAFEACTDTALFVNLHPEELASRWIVRTDDPIGFHSKQVYLEITESAALTHHDLCLGVVKELCRRTHALLVVDDFGAGYSNLDRLAELEPAMVKLDLVLVRDVHLSKRKQIVIKHVVALCKELGASVVAEGVEKIEELDCVKSLGVEYVQGYLLAKPAPKPPEPWWPTARR
jgi:EAL domain-containing protein (putative c-di-GMP-specific phosphodiesterase class I)